MDFQTRLEVDEETGDVFLVLVPDPARHEWREVEGKRYLIDKLDDSAIEESVFVAGLKDLQLPLYDRPPGISDSPAYVASRRDAFRARLLGDDAPPTFESPSDSFLQSISSSTNDFVILSLDIVGSTKRATSQRLEVYAKTMQAVLSEVAEVLPLFHGHVLKFTGDGVLAYFAAPGYLAIHDLAIDCALTLRRLVYDGLNPVLQDLGGEGLDIRVGMDSGTVAVLPVGSPSTKQEKDLLGEVVSLACKIQARAPRGGIALGEETLRNLHHRWRAICEEMPTASDWSYTNPHTGEPYRLWRVRGSEGLTALPDASCALPSNP